MEIAAHGGTYVAAIGAAVSLAAVIFCVVYPNSRLGRGVVVMLSLVTVLLATSAVFSTRCAYYGNCEVWAYVLGFVTLGLGVLNLYYAFTMRMTYDAYVAYNAMYALDEAGSARKKKSAGKPRARKGAAASARRRVA